MADGKHMSVICCWVEIETPSRDLLIWIGLSLLLSFLALSSSCILDRADFVHASCPRTASISSPSSLRISG